MDALFIAIGYRDALWLTMAFVAGFAFQLIALPPLIGFLVAGFTLNFLGTKPTLFLSELADMGVTLFCTTQT